MSTEIHKPIIAFTVGDINGVGPELIVKTLSNQNLLKMCTPVVYGSGKLFSYYKKLLKISHFSYKQIKSFDEIDRNRVNVVNCWKDELALSPGQSTIVGGKASWLSLKEAAFVWVQGRVDGLVTAPINKSNIQSEDFKFPGHTGYLTNLSGKKTSLMLMTSPRLKMGVVTEHIPVKDIAKTLTKELLIEKMNVLNSTLRTDFGIQRPKIAVLGINPHAGDNGLLGEEEKNIIEPSLKILKEKDVLAFGPFSSDGFFGTMQYKNYDAVLAMYHDQGLIPFKTIAFEDGVNYTAGLELIRTSPDHGTAYEIVGKDRVNVQSFLHSIYTIIDIVRNRKEVNSNT